MTDPTEQFIEAAVRPLEANSEMQVLAGQELRAAIEEAPDRPEADSLDQATENLKKGGLPRWFKATLYSLTALAVVLTAIPLARDFLRYRLATFIGTFGTNMPDAFPIRPLRLGPDTVRVFGEFSEADQRLLFGEFPRSGPAKEQFKALWDSDPANAAYYAEYIRGIAWSGSPSTPLPADYLTTADRLDPDNGWFRCFAAGVAARNAVQRSPAGSRTTKAGRIPALMVKDPAKLAEVATWLEEAARQPRFESYESKLLLQRIDALPPGDDTLGRLFVKNYMMMGPRPSYWIHKAIGEAVSVKCHELALAGDAQGFLKVTASWETFLRRSLENSGQPDDTGSLLVGLSAAATELMHSAKTLGLTEKEGRYQRLANRMKEHRISSPKRLSTAWEIRRRSGPDAYHLIFARAKLDDPPPLGDADLRPGLRANIAAREWLRSAVVGTIMLVAALYLAGLRFYRGPQVRVLSASVMRILQPKDYAWILLGGVILPVLVLIVTEPLEANFAHDYDWELDLLKSVIQAGLLLFLSMIIAVRRLDRRLGTLGWKVRGIPEPIAIGVGLFMVVVSRFATPQLEASKLWLLALCSMVPFAISYPLLPLGASFCPRKIAVLWHTCCRALVPAHVLSALLLFLLVPCYRAVERHWTKLNVLTKIEPGVPALNRYELQVQEQVRKELLELLDAKP